MKKYKRRQIKKRYTSIRRYIWMVYHDLIGNFFFLKRYTLMEILFYNFITFSGKNNTIKTLYPKNFFMLLPVEKICNIIFC